MRYTLRYGVITNIKKLQNKFVNLSVASMFALTTLSGAAPLFTTSTVYAASEIDIHNVSELRDAIRNQADGQTWNIEAGNYGLSAFTDITAGCPTSCQTGWYFPVTANDLTINGIGNPTIYGTGYSTNGNWASQNFVSVFGNNVTINGVTLMPKVEPNKTIEVLGSNFTLANTVIEPNTLTDDQSEYDNIPNAQDSQDERQWGGSLYFSHSGNHTISNVTINNAGVSFRYAPAGTHIAFSNVKIIDTSNVDWINGYRFSTGYNEASNSNTGQPSVEYHVNSTLDNLNSVLANIHAGEKVYLDSDLTVPSQKTINKQLTFDGQGHAVSVSGTGYRFLVIANGTTFKNMDVVKTDKTGVQNIFGIQASDVTIDGVNFTGQFVLGDGDVSRALEISGNNFVIKNSSFKNLRQPAYVNGYTGTISNNHLDGTKGWVVVQDSHVTFTGNTWGTNATDIAIIQQGSGANYYTCPVMSQIAADNNHPNVDNQVLTTSCDTIAPAVPTLYRPADGATIRPGDAILNWNDVTDPSGPVTYNYQSSYSDNVTGSNNGFSSPIYHASTGTASQIDATHSSTNVYFWQVQACDSVGNCSSWSGPWKVTIDGVRPTLSNFHITSPHAAYGSSVSVAADATDNFGVKNVAFYVTAPRAGDGVCTGNGTHLADSNATSPSSGSTYSGSLNTAGLNGDHCLNAVAGDIAANHSLPVATLKVTFDNTTPSVAFTNPSAGAVRHNLKVSVNMDGTGSHLVQYGFDVSGPSGVHFSTANYHIDQSILTLTDFDLCAAATYGTCPSNLPDGTYAVRAKAYDAAGNRNISTTLSFSIDNTAPVATIDAYSGTDTTPTLTGTVDDPTADLTITVDGGTPANATNNGDGTWTYTLPTVLSVGTHSIVLTATDTADNSYTTSANATVQAPPASPQGIVHSSSNGNSNQAPGHQPAVSVTPNNDGHVLGDSTGKTESLGQVKGDSTTKSNDPTVNFANTGNSDNTKSANSFLGLGWWWLAAIAAVALFFGLVFRISGTNKTNAS